MRAVSITTENRYRNNAKRHNDIPHDVLKVRLNCLINATDREHVYKRGNATVYQFGSCLLSVTGNIITNIRWTGNNESPSSQEQYRLKTWFLRYGLTSDGSRFAHATRQMEDQDFRYSRNDENPRYSYDNSYRKEESNKKAENQFFESDELEQEFFAFSELYTTFHEDDRDACEEFFRENVGFDASPKEAHEFVLSFLEKIVNEHSYEEVLSALPSTEELLSELEQKSVSFAKEKDSMKEKESVGKEQKETKENKKSWHLFGDR